MDQAFAVTDLSLLNRSDGSASYSRNGYAVVGAVNGPLEVQRRDELPEEAAIDVIIRPTAGVGCMREKHLETLLQNVLRRVVLVSAHPRTLIQITLQIIASPGEECLDRLEAKSSISILPALLHTAILALLSTSIPLLTTLTTTIMSVDGNGLITTDPSLQVLEMAASAHVLAFTSAGDLLIEERVGDFDMDIWEQTLEEAESLGCRQINGDHGINGAMNSQDSSKLESMLRNASRAEILAQENWRNSMG